MIFKQKINDFAIASLDQCMANILLDLLDNKLSMPIKCQGLLDMFNGIEAVQTRHYIKIDCHSYIVNFAQNILIPGTTNSS